MGLSCVRVVSANEATGVMEFSGCDLIDGTFVLDIKPYVPYCDAFTGARVPIWLRDNDPDREREREGDRERDRAAAPPHTLVDGMRDTAARVAPLSLPSSAAAVVVPESSAAATEEGAKEEGAR